MDTNFPLLSRREVSVFLDTSFLCFGFRRKPPCGCFLAYIIMYMFFVLWTRVVHTFSNLTRVHITLLTRTVHISFWASMWVFSISENSGFKTNIRLLFSDNVKHARRDKLSRVSMVTSTRGFNFPPTHDEPTRV